VVWYVPCYCRAVTSRIREPNWSQAVIDFPHQFRPAAHIVTLEQNYRSTQPILDACNQVIRFAKERYTKNLRSDRQSKQKPFLTIVTDEAAQAHFVAQQILDSREAGVPLKAQAVLFRASYHSAQLEIELTRRNIPFVKYGGLKFLEAAHVKDVLSILRWWRTRGTEWRGFERSSCCLELGLAPQQKFWTRLKLNPMPLMCSTTLKCLRL
jgi:DNA helicase II / ATP-dependent DNA helicase PcrA